MIQRAKVFVENSFAYRGLNFYLLGYGPNGETLIGRQVEFVDHDPAQFFHDPTFRLERDEAQGLMDMLWQCGLRPTEGAGSAGALAASQDHLSTLKNFSDRLLKIVEREPIEIIQELK